MCKICSKDDVLSVLFSNIYIFCNIYYCVFFSVMTTFCFVGEFFMFLALKIPKCLDNSTMLEESVFLLIYFQCKLAIGELIRSELKFFKQKEQKYRQVIMSSIKSSVT